MTPTDVQPFIFKCAPTPDLAALCLVGDRVILRSVEERDAAVMFAEFNAAVTRYMYPKPAEHLDETLEFIARSRAAMESQTELVLAITLSDDGFLGCCGVHLTQGPRSPELGIWIKQSAQGQGYGREAICTVARWLVQTLAFDYVIYPVDRANIASRKIPEALGGVVFREQVITALTGHVLDEVVYKISTATLSTRLAAAS
ncbi:GNAT family N-acetyltransferase [Leptolyngbya iicbica]|uniref:N-acetyltransferase n=2 Tax=Cyanophyceae TaxID=3028117 RepID=A0A4Q7ELX2_9CYAN|nr:GNAT family N-acetyltransferase [Leptolyngbya sp. LK]RZM82799.1 N-acetyltransferase [Leptolyngbya sp. LK]